MSISNILKGATVAEDADTAAVFAEVLNNDFRAIAKLRGGNRFEADDALRISRIWAEYQAMDKPAKPRTPVYQRSVAADAN